MAKDLPVTLDGKVIYHIKLTDSFQGLAEELKQLGYQADQKICGKLFAKIFFTVSA